MNIAMSQIDSKTRAVLDYLRARINEIPHKGRLELARAAKVDPATISRIGPKAQEYPNYHPKTGTVLRLIEQICGKFPLKISNSELLSNLPSHGKGGKQEILVRWLQGMSPDDLELVYQMIEMIKFKSLFNRVEWGGLVGLMATMHKLLTMQVPLEELLLTADEGLPNKLN